MSQRGKGPTKRHPFAAALGTVGVLVLGATIAYYWTPVLDRLSTAMCPLPVICPSERAFAASARVQCQDGFVGGLVTRAYADGVLLEPVAEEEKLAKQAYLCAEADWQKKPTIEHLKRLAEEFNNCFDFRPTAGPPEGRSGAVGPRFSVRIGRPQICLAPIKKSQGVWQAVAEDKNGRLFCFPHASDASARPSTISGLRRCTTEELAGVQVPNSVISQIK